MHHSHIIEQCVQTKGQPLELMMLTCCCSDTGSWSRSVSVRPHRHYFESINWLSALCVCCWCLLEHL